MLEETSPGLKTQGSVCLRIQRIEVDLNSQTEYPICLKLLLRERVQQLFDQVAVKQPLRWVDVWPIMAKSDDIIELRVYEVHRFRRRVRTGTVKFRVNQVETLPREAWDLKDNTGLVPCSVRFTFVIPGMELDVARAAQKSALATLDLNPSILTSLGKTRNMIETVLRFGHHLSELHPAAEVTLGLCIQAWEVLKEQDKCDMLVKDLIIGMGDMLPLIDSAKDYAGLGELKATILAILNLINDSSRFVISYEVDAGIARAARAFVSSAAQDQVNNFLERFKSLKEAFDRGLNVQVVQGVSALLDDADREILTKLVTPDAGYDPDAGCLEGTRMELRNDIHQWADSDDSSQSLLWLCGLAGCGKSTVARSVCKKLHEDGLLAAAFFCKRDNEQLRKPENIVSTLSANLAFACPSYGAKLVAALRDKPQLATSALAIRFHGMITEPIQSLDKAVQQPTLVMVVDALDECASVESRVPLVKYLLELSHATPWLKVIITSRPNDEFVRFFHKEGKMAPRRDLFQEDPESVSRDISVFIRHRLSQLIEDDDELSQNTWLIDGTVGDLATRANGLFIWAQTACNVICNSVDPDKKISSMLAGESLQDANTQLDLLYTNVLDEALGGLVDDTLMIKCCIAAVVITRSPLVDTALSELLVNRVGLTALRLVIRRLASVLYRDHHGAVRVLHKSFIDYMLERCPSQYRIDRYAENWNISVSCLQIMIRELKFNICGLEDSQIYNHEIPDLASRIRNTITPSLEYSCVYWASHLVGTPSLDPNLEQHQIIIELIGQLLLEPRALYWIELLSLLGKLYSSETNLLEVQSWIQDPIHKLSTQAGELQRFVAAFYLPISQSAAHLYISAMALGSQQFDAIERLKTQFPNTVKIVRGRHLGKLSTGWLRVMPHPDTVEAMAYSPDGNLIATGSRDGMVRVWDSRTCAAVLKPLQGHSSIVTSIAFSRSSQRIASGSVDATVRVWDATTGVAALEPLKGHRAAVMSVEFSPDDQRIASGSMDREIRLWDASTGAAVGNPLLGHTDWVTSVAFSPDGQRLASGSDDKTVRLWDELDGGSVSKALIGHSGIVTSVVFSPDGQRIASSSVDMSVRLWNVEDGTAVFNPFLGHSRTVTSVAFSPDGKFIASGSVDKTVRIWDGLTGAAILNPLQGHSGIVTTVRFSSDGQRIASSSFDETVRVWDGLATTNNVPRPLQGHSHAVTAVAFSPNGQLIASGSVDMTVRIWDGHTGTPVLEPLQGHSKTVRSVAFSPDNNRIVSGSADMTLRVWDINTGAIVLKPFKGHLDIVTSVVYSPDGRRIASGSVDMSVRIWDETTGIAVFAPLQGHTNTVTSIAFSPSGKYIVSGSVDRTVRIWDAQTGVAFLGPLRGHFNTIRAVAFSLDGQCIFSGSVDMSIRGWDAETGTGVFAIDAGRPHTDRVLSVAFSPDGHTVVLGSADKSILVRHSETGVPTQSPLQGHSRPATALALSSDGKRIVSGSNDATVRIWATSTSTSTPNPPTSELSSIFIDLPLPISAAHVLGHQLSSTYEGWVLDRNGKPMLWLPDIYRRRSPDHSMFAISKDPSTHPVSFDFSKFKYGAEWAAVRNHDGIDA